MKNNLCQEADDRFYAIGYTEVTSADNWITELSGFRPTGSAFRDATVLQFSIVVTSCREVKMSQQQLSERLFSPAR